MGIRRGAGQLRLLLEAEASDSRTLIDYRQMEDACDLDSVGLFLKGLKQEESEMHPPSRLTSLIGLYCFIYYIYICLYCCCMLLHVAKDIPRY